jgi:acetylornithine deacetylase/succinyl-diaminopimelate desuccinylase-like protein
VRDDDARGVAQDNVLPTSAKAKVNCSILPREARAQVKATLEKLIDDPNVVLTQGEDSGDAASSPFDGEVLDAGPRRREEGRPVALSGYAGGPGLSSGTTDSRHLRNIGIKAYGVSPGMGSRAEATAGHAAHCADERKSIQWIEPGAD